MEKKLFLLDAYALIFRAYYAFIKNPRINSKGQNTSATFGFILALDDILRKENPSHIAVVFDPPTPTFRHKQYPEYKANRKATPEDIKLSVPFIKRVIEAYNIPIVEVDGFEADDTIGTLAKKAAKEDFQVFMMTPDKDYAQLVEENIFMYKPNRSGKGVEILGIPEVQEKFEVSTTDQIIDLLGLMGDSADNVPGCPGVGPKTATKLIAKYGSIEGIYENIEDLKGKQKENLVNNKEKVMLSKELVTICTEVPTEFQAETFERKDIDKEKIKELFDELEFRTLLSRLGIESSPAPSATPIQGDLFGGTPIAAPIQEEVKTKLQNLESTEHEYFLIDTAEKRAELIKKLLEQEEFCFDTETTGIDSLHVEIVGLAFAFERGKAYYIPFGEDQEECKTILAEFKDVFESEKSTKIGQNLKYDINVLSLYGISVKGKIWDTLIAHYLLQPEQKHKLDVLAENYLDYEMVSIESLIGKKGKKQLSMRQVPIEEQKEYAGEDADITLQLKQVLEKQIIEQKLEDLFTEIEMPLVAVLADMELSGVRLNAEILKDYSKELSEELKKLETSIHELAGEDFNISSPKQLGDILFEKLKIDDKAKKTKTKQYSTSEEVLQKLLDKHEIVPKILEFRSVKKLLSTYVEALPELISERTGKIHTSYNQAVAATGRLSSNNPNLQNIPIREERGRKIREAFVPSDENHTFLSADYSQIELRLIAHMSGDEGMIYDFNHEADVHTATAAKIYNVKADEVSREMRSKAKTANFGIIYGISSFGLAQRLNIKRGEAKELIEGYFRTYPGVKEFMNKSIEEARERGFVETLLNRKRILADINSRNAIVRGVAERNAINAPIQGTAADIIKKAMVKIHCRMQAEGLKSKMILQVHDELNFDAHKDELDKLKTIVSEEMESVLSLSVPLSIEMGEGDNWLQAH